MEVYRRTVAAKFCYDRGCVCKNCYYKENLETVCKMKTAYIVYGVNLEGYKEILGIWIGESKSSKFWMLILSDLKQRGVKDILIASVDGLKAFIRNVKYNAALFIKSEIHQNLCRGKTEKLSAPI